VIGSKKKKKKFH